MVRRPQRDCLLCSPDLDEEVRSRLWYRYQETDQWEALASSLQAYDLDLSAAEVRAHLQYHRVVQPAPRGYLKRQVALDRSLKLPQRMQEMIVVIGRVRGLSATSLAELFYWNGQAEQLASARNACYRDLRRLVRQDFVYRYYPEARPRPQGTQRRQRQDQLSIYFLGRDGVPLVEHRDGIELSRSEFVARPEQLADDFRVVRLHDQAQIVASLARQIQIQGGQPLAVDGLDLELAFQPLNWYDAQRSAIRYEALAQSGTLVPSGLAALTVRIPTRDLSTLTPFFYELDGGTRPLDAFAEALLDYVGLSRSEQLSDRFPDLPRKGYFPPVLLVCREVARVAALRRECQRLASKRGIADAALPIIICCDERSLIGDGLSGPVWTSLWENSEQGRSYRLPEVLLRASRPLIGGHLDGDALLTWEGGGENRIHPGRAT